MMNERYEEFVFREGYRRGKADRHKMLDDGTLVVSVDDATKVTRVFVEDDKKNGDLYYADRPQGKWFKDDEGTFICSACGSGYKDQPTLMGKPMFEWCPLCGARMKGADDGSR